MGIVLAGCAGTRTVDQQSATTLLESSDYAGYARLYLDAEGKPKYDNTSLLDSLEAVNQNSAQEARREVAEASVPSPNPGRSTVQGDLRRTSVVKRWEQKDDNGVLHVGAVVACC